MDADLIWALVVGCVVGSGVWLWIEHLRAVRDHRRRCSHPGLRLDAVWPEFIYSKLRCPECGHQEDATEHIRAQQMAQWDRIVAGRMARCTNCGGPR